MEDIGEGKLKMYRVIGKNHSTGKVIYQLGSENDKEWWWYIAEDYYGWDLDRDGVPDWAQQP